LEVEAMKLDWKPIIKTATKAAEDLGHKLGPIDRAKHGIFGGNALRMMRCETCCGCGWVAWIEGGGAHTDSQGFGCGGRILKYRCGTPEAQGFKRGAGDDR
jgi:hypothetical protein